MSVKLLTDSATDINQEEAEELGIELLSMPITFGNEEFLDGVDLLPAEFYNKLETCTELPKTSQINTYRYEEAFEKITKDGDDVVVITISSKLSGTYRCAVQAAENFKDKVYVVDSLNATTGQKILCLYALKLISKGLSAKEIAEELEKVKSKIHIFAMVDTLKFLKMGGRLSGAATAIGTLMSIKPIVAIIDGEVKNIGKTMGFNKAIRLLNDMIRKSNVDYDKPYGYIWSGNDKSNIEKYMESSKEFFTENTPYYCLGATIGTHVGHGAVGVAYFEK